MITSVVRGNKSQKFISDWCNFQLPLVLLLRCQLQHQFCLQLHWQLNQTPLAHHCVFCKSFQREWHFTNAVAWHCQCTPCLPSKINLIGFQLRFLVKCSLFCVICFIFNGVCMILHLNVLCVFDCFDVCRFVHVIFVCFVVARNKFQCFTYLLFQSFCCWVCCNLCQCFTSVLLKYVLCWICRS